MARNRLTSRARQAADDQTPYPGSINQEGREEEGRGSMTYRTFEPSVANHELTDYTRVHGVSDQRNDIGMGIPDPASGMLVASPEYQAKCIKAAELAETYLGPKVSDRMLLAQAREFLALSDDSLDRTLERFNRTDAIYASEEEEVAEVVASEEEGEEAPVVEETPVVVASEDEEAEEVAEAAEEVAEDVSGGEEIAEADEVMEEAEEVAEMPAEAPAAAPAPAETDNPTLEIPAMPEGQAASPQVNVDGSVGVMDPNAAATSPVPVQEEVSGELEVSVASNLDIGSFDLTEEFNDGPVVANAEDDAELASIFGGEPMIPQMPVSAEAINASVAQLANVKTASKVGVQSVGSAKLQNSAPASEGADLDGLWSSPSEFPGGGF